MARRNSFDFAYTCPKIDKAIDSCKDALESYLSGYIEDLCPYIPQAEVERISELNDKASYTISCCKCKKVEDTFTKDENPNDFGWTKYRNKWYCKPCFDNL